MVFLKNDVLVIKYEHQESFEIYYYLALSRYLTQHNKNSFIFSFHFNQQNGDTCYCDNVYGLYGALEEVDCNVPCAGNSAVMCGGSYKNTIFTVDGMLLNVDQYIHSFHLANLLSWLLLAITFYTPKAAFLHCR